MSRNREYNNTGRSCDKREKDYADTVENYDNMSNEYEDIIDLPYPISRTGPRMSIIDRAAQFSPFAALTGYDAAVSETARLTDERAELSEDVKAVLADRLQLIAERIKERHEISITYFKPDKRKRGGAYHTAIGVVKRIDEFRRVVVMADGERIPIDEIFGIEGEMFGPVFGE